MSSPGEMLSCGKCQRCSRKQSTSSKRGNKPTNQQQQQPTNQPTNQTREKKKETKQTHTKQTERKKKKPTNKPIKIKEKDILGPCSVGLSAVRQLCLLLSHLQTVSG